MCKYSHGDDAIVPGQLYPSAPGIPFMFPGNIPFLPGAAYDPHEARMDMRPRQHQRAPLLPRIQQEDGSVVHPVNSSGELPVIQDLTPIVPATPTMPVQGPLPSDDVEMKNSNNPILPAVMAGYNPVAALGMNGSQYQPANAPMEVDSKTIPGMRPPTRSRGGPRGRGRGGRGTFGGEVHTFRPEKRNDRTLVVEKIPEEKLSLDQVNEWFKRFGTVTNVAIDAVGGKALVSFEKHEEAHGAWRSEEAVFGNRFVKVFWHRPLEGHGQVGARMLAASAPLVANIANKEKAVTTSPSTTTDVGTSTAASAQASSSANASRKVSAVPGSSTASALAVKQQFLEQKIAEQKSLMSDLGKASAEEKKGIMARLRNLGEEMTQLTSTTSTLEASSAPVTNGSHKSNSDKVLHEKKEDRLDKELEVHNKAEGSSTTDDLKAKLERLKAEVNYPFFYIFYVTYRFLSYFFLGCKPRSRLNTSFNNCAAFALQRWIPWSSASWERVLPWCLYAWRST
jgi:RNA-binding protein 26